MNKDLRYFILNENKRPLYENTDGHVDVVASGILKPDGEPAHLEYSPDGWRESLIKFGRSSKYLGKTTDFSVPLKFVRDGGKIVKDSMWRIGTDVIRYLAIWKLNKFIFPDTYRHWYTGELDFSKKSQTSDGFTIQITEGGLNKLFKANESTTYELDIHNDPEKKVLYMDGMPFTNTVRWKMYDEDFFATNTYPGAGVVSNEGTTQGVLYQDQEFKAGVDPLTTNKDNWFLYSVDKNITANFTGKIIIPDSNADISYIKFVKRNLNSFGTTTDYSISGTVTPTPYPFVVDIALSIPMAPGDQLFYEGRCSGSGSGPFVAINKESFFELTYDVTFTPTFTEYLTPKRVAILLVDKLAPGCTVSSTLLDSLEDTVALTSGQSLRKYGAESFLKTSISEFYKFIQFYGAGLAIEGNVLVIEKHEYFFKTNKVANLGVVSDWEIVDAEDLVYNTFKFGYPNVEVDKVNGRDEFNVSTQFTSPLKRVIKELDLVGPYHAGMYEIEVARIDLYGKDTTDSRVDNTVYKLDVEKGYSFDYYTGDIFLPFQDELQMAGTQPPLVAGDQLTISGAASNNGTFPIAAFLYATGTTDITFATNVFTGTPVTINGTISITSANNYKLARPVYDVVTGLLHPDKAFNIPSRPKQAFYNNGAYLRSILDFHDAESVVFASGDRNSELSTTLAGVTITENSNEPIGGLPVQWFKPYYLRCKAKVSDTDWDTMNNNPYSLIDVIIEDQTISVYKWDGARNPVTEQVDTLTFLIGPGNDMSKLINL